MGFKTILFFCLVGVIVGGAFGSKRKFRFFCECFPITSSPPFSEHGHLTAAEDFYPDLHHYLDPQALSRLLRSDPSIRLLKRAAEEYSGAVDDIGESGDDAELIGAAGKRGNSMMRLMKKAGMVRLLRSGMVRLLKRSPV